MKKKILFTRVGYTYVPTTKIDESIYWYTKNLGLKLIDKFEDRGSLIAVLHYPHKNAIAVVLIETKDYGPLYIMRNGVKFPVMAMSCLDIEYTYKILKENGVEVDDINILGDGEAKYFYFKDNEGNLLEAAWSIWDLEDEVKENFYEY
ncbi:VOC family protein [Alkaliphilus peptidifermentans]|uniref:Glyoxalase/Bleomycin resistance protein/Dioxygenase superfamily protein n=1 Tax=Alkaliphilus peptidifermentans DSM 18978 TaxID=1120976 RepID=A0A1G5GXQ6_9FIRM|nr:VOC family protein [Alkaliphilus peptidifermentans]SCY56326.1 Glyoxalase/Bleomycin resistance protein/Dioxygenase superfamily protein [Alkaliphilus peptidifermentans DSM 18978]